MTCRDMQHDHLFLYFRLIQLFKSPCCCRHLVFRNLARSQTNFTYVALALIKFYLHWRHFCSKYNKKYYAEQKNMHDAENKSRIC